MRIPKLKLKTIKESFKKLPRTFGERAFLTFLGLLIIALISGGLIFYRYRILVEKAAPQITEKPLQFQEKTYEEILKVWQEKEKRFDETNLKIYPDPFR